MRRPAIIARRTWFNIVAALALGFLAVSPIFVPQVARAETKSNSGLFFTPEIPLPGLFDKAEQPVDNTLLANYIKAIFIYFIWVVGIVAVVMVIYGGVRWVAAAGNAGRIKEARDIIDNAVIGVIIALTSVVLLNIINPKLTQIGIPSFRSLKKITFVSDQSVVKKVCPASDTISCGEYKEIGVAKNSSGQEVPEYCLGTTCAFGDIIGLEKPEVCNVTTSTTTGNYTSGRCITELVLKDPVPSKFAEHPSMPVNFNRFVRLNCGNIQDNITENGNNPYSVGHVCRDKKNDMVATCYVTGRGSVKLAPIPTIVSPDTISNMYCAPK
jgi:hypothetical protein